MWNILNANQDNQGFQPKPETDSFTLNLPARSSHEIITFWRLASACLPFNLVLQSTTEPLLHMYTEFVLERTGHDKITLSAKKRRGDNNSPLADSQDCEHIKRKKNRL